MFAFFDIVAIAFIIALILYESVQYVAAHWGVIHTSSKVVLDPKTQRILVDLKRGPRSVGLARKMVWARYSRRSVVFHQLNAMQFPDVQAKFKSWQFFGLSAMGATLCVAAGLPVITAFGIGVCGGLAAFVSKQGRDLVRFSDEIAQFDDDVKNATLYARKLIRTRRT